MIIIDGKQVQYASDYNTWVDTIEKALSLVRGKDYQMPKRSHIDFDKNTLLLMPCIGTDYYATKLVSMFPENYKMELPSVQGSVILNSSETGEALAIIDGSELTALRTAAVGSFGIRHLAPSSVSSLGIVGAGKQGTYQCLMACSQRDFKKVFVYDSSEKGLASFSERIRIEYPDLEIHYAENTEELCKYSEVIITATSSNSPVLPDNKDLLVGKTIIGIGSYKPDMREFPDSLYDLCTEIFIDTDDGKCESGDLIYPIETGKLNDDQIINVHDFLVKKLKPVSDTRVFKTVGMAIFDLQGAILVYESLTKTKN